MGRDGLVSAGLQWQDHVAIDVMAHRQSSPQRPQLEPNPKLRRRLRSRRAGLGLPNFSVRRCQEAPQLIAVQQFEF
jgi:hypothetical protein